jgi:cytoskeletal protein RodZ
MQNDPLIELGSLIKSRREELGLSIEDLSAESRVSIRHIKNIEEARRDLLPEETYLVGFLNLLLKALKLEHKKIINDYKYKDGTFIVQSIINQTDEPLAIQKHSTHSSKKEPAKIRGQYFKIYHLYILATIVVIFLALSFINKASKTIKEVPNIKEEQSEELFQEIKPEGEEKEEAVEAAAKPDSLSTGQGSYSLNIKIIEPAWVQIIAIGTGNVLFEGDVFPDHGLGEFDFHDNVGFVLATGNAGAFKVSTGGAFKKLGESGQLTKWYYPESAKVNHLDKVKQNKEEHKEKLKQQEDAPQQVHQVTESTPENNKPSEDGPVL